MPEEPDKTPQPVDYDERIYRKGHPPHRVRNALILIALVIAGTYLALTKSLPFGDPYEVKAVFDNAANIREGSPVRIAGVNVGEVKGVEGVGDDAAEITFTVTDEGQPVREDSTAEIRPRIFLEGNFFIDLKPGSPSAPELPDEGTIPITQTATAVQLDQILTTLQAPDRENLQRLLQGYGDALNTRSTRRQDRAEDPDIEGETAAQSINDSFKYGAQAARDSTIVNEALLGTEPGDLSGLIAANADVFDALLTREQQLQDLITNFNVTVGAFADESNDLSETVRLLAPTLETAQPSLVNTNRVLPYLRAFARDIRPGIAELPATIAASPAWLKQTGRLLKQSELGYIADELRRAAPGTATAASDGKGLFTQVGLLGRCSDQVLFPTGDVVLNDSGVGYNFETGVENYKEFGYAVTGLAGESQAFDGNGPYLRFLSGGGPQKVRDATFGGFQQDALWGFTVADPIGTRPVTGGEPAYRTDVACHANAVPDLNGPAAFQGPPSPEAVP